MKIGSYLPIEAPTPRNRGITTKCALCEIPLASYFGSATRRKYCDDCAKNFQRHIYNAWHRRAYARRTGKRQEKLTCKNIYRLKRITAEERDNRLQTYQVLKSKGYSYGQIAEQFGVTRSAVWKFMKTYA